MTDGDSCCIAVVAKNISPVTTLSLLFFHLYLGTSLFHPSPRAVVPRAPRFPLSLHPLRAGERLFASCCSPYPAAVTVSAAAAAAAAAAATAVGKIC